jgi:hypothetical protein
MNANTVVETKEIVPELVEESTALDRRSPSIPATLAELAALKGEALEVVEARIMVLETLRKASIRATHPADWLLFKSPDGNVTSYLQDCGADRVRDLYGIEIFNVSIPQKVAGLNGEFTYIIMGSGRCKLTRQILENVEGGRSSTDDFCSAKKGAELELSVRKAARANLDGNITRELAGLKNVPLQELQSAWTGTNKNSTNCRLGRGFGNKQERDGVSTQTAGAPTKAPICDSCQEPMDYVRAGEKDGRKWEAYWKCKQYKWDSSKRQSNGHSRVDGKLWEETVVKIAASEAQREPGSEG